MAEVPTVEQAQDLDEASLVRAAQAGDADAFAVLFRRHHDTVRRVCARRLADAGDADDVAQAAFVRAYERIDQCAGDRRFGAWVQVIALRLCGDVWRARARTTPVADPVPWVGAAGGTDSCSDALLRKERAAAVRGALATLPARQREVIVARYVEGRRPRDVAAALAVSVGAVDSLLLRARRRLALACQVAGVEQGSTTTSVAATSLAAGSAATQLRPLARLGGAVYGVLEAVGAAVTGVAGTGPVAPTLAQRAAGLVGAGALLLAPLAPGAEVVASPPTVTQASAAGPDAGRPAQVIPGEALASLTLPAVSMPDLTLPPVPSLALPGLAPVPAGTGAAVGAVASGATQAGPVRGTADGALDAPVAAAGQVVQTVTAAVGEATATVTSAVDEVTGTVAALLAGLSPPRTPAVP